MSMLTEACAALKPVYVFDLRTRPRDPLVTARRLDRQGRHILVAPRPAPRVALVFRIAFVISPA